MSDKDNTDRFDEENRKNHERKGERWFSGEKDFVKEARERADAKDKEWEEAKAKEELESRDKAEREEGEKNRDEPDIDEQEKEAQHEREKMWFTGRSDVPQPYGEDKSVFARSLRDVIHTQLEKRFDPYKHVIGKPESLNNRENVREQPINDNRPPDMGEPQPDRQADDDWGREPDDSGIDR